MINSNKSLNLEIKNMLYLQKTMTYKHKSINLEIK